MCNMKEIKKFWLMDCDEEEDIFARTSWMVPGFNRLRLSRRKPKAAGRSRATAPLTPSGVSR